MKLRCDLLTFCRFSEALTLSPRLRASQKVRFSCRTQGSGAPHNMHPANVGAGSRDGIEGCVELRLRLEQE